MINEISATGAAGYLDADGEASDWIELTNNGGASEGLGGYFLTDDATELTRWQLPPIDLAPGGFVVIFASGKDRATAGAELHTNFSLDRSGEFLALVEPDGTSIVEQFSPNYPEQAPDFSYGRTSNNQLAYLGPTEPRERQFRSGLLWTRC